MVTMLKARLNELKPRLGSSGKRAGSVGLRWTGRKLQAWRTRILRGEPLCRHCKAMGRLTPASEVDHEIPLGQGGTYDDSNAQPLCKSCHQIKTKAEAQGGQSSTRRSYQGGSK